MFDLLTRVQIYETISEIKKNKLEEALNEKKIEYTVEKESFQNRNSFDPAYLSHILSEDKYVYTFWTTKKYKNEAKSIVKSLFK